MQASQPPSSPKPEPRSAPLYDGDGERLMAHASAADRITLLPDAPDSARSTDRLRIMWGQPMLGDMLTGRYRTVVCGVNTVDNSHGIIAHLAELVPASQWRAATITAHVKMFAEAVVKHSVAGQSREPYVVKFDLEDLEVLALLRPASRDHFTIEDLSRGFRQVTLMLQGRRDRLPAASVSFLGGRSNRLLGPDGREPSFETVLRTMFEAGFRGDVYPSPQMWAYGGVGTFSGYPFPAGLDRMRTGGF